MRLVEFVEQGINALTLLVCGRNEKHQSDFEVWDWDGVIRQYHRAIVNGRWSAVVGGGGSVTPMSPRSFSATACTYT